MIVPFGGIFAAVISVYFVVKTVRISFALRTSLYRLFHMSLPPCSVPAVFHGASFLRFFRGPFAAVISIAVLQALAPVLQ